MDSLSSCYFCGTALDEPLGTYQVGDSDPGTVTLCQSCHHKLDTVFETAGLSQVMGSETTRASNTQAASEPISGADQSAATDQTASATESDTDSSEPTPESEESTEGEVFEEPDTPSAADDDTEANAASAESSDEPVAAGPEADDILVDPESDSPLEATSEDDSGLTLNEEMEPDMPDELETANEGEESDPGGGDSEEDENAEAGATETAPAQESTDKEQSAEASTQSGETGEDGVPARTTISALEYNKVMRLLQNREFPVDRGEIEAIATSAYDLTQAECAEVIDLAVDRDLIEQREGQLHRPDE